jgi:hypothetical protein
MSAKWWNVEHASATQGPAVRRRLALEADGQVEHPPRDCALAAGAEAHDPRCVRCGEPVAGVDRHEPELVVVEGVERAQRGVDLAGVTVALNLFQQGFRRCSAGG